MAKRPSKTGYTTAYPASPKPARGDGGSKTGKVSKSRKTAMVRARVNAELKSRAEGILARLGLNASDAVRLFYKQITLQNGLPFDVRIPNATTRKALRDADAGKNLARYETMKAMVEDLTR